MDRPPVTLPRPTRSRRTRATVLLAALTAVVTLAGVACTKNAQAFDSASRVNDTRSQMGLHTLSIDATLVDKAQSWAEHLARIGTIAHSRLSDGAGNNWTVLGENVGMASSTAQMHSMFMNSAAHRANIVNGRFTRIGTGVAEAGGKLFVVQVFAG
jgi:uncharacterized protein YkwD